MRKFRSFTYKTVLKLLEAIYFRLSQIVVQRVTVVKSGVDTTIVTTEAAMELPFYPRDAMLARVIAIATCLSVCLSRAGIVSKRSIIVFSPSGRPKTLVF